MVEGWATLVEVPRCLGDVLCGSRGWIMSVKWVKEEATKVEGVHNEIEKGMYARGIWGLIARPSASTSAGAVPAFRAASRSFCRRNSSLESFPAAINRSVTLISSYFSQKDLPEEAIMRVKSQGRWKVWSDFGDRIGHNLVTHDFAGFLSSCFIFWGLPTL